MTLTPTDTQTDAQTDAQPDVPAGQSDPTAPTRVWGWLDDPRARKVANSAAAIFFFYWLLQRLWPAPAGVLLKGAVIGGLYSLIALGIALTYRANRIINFAQGDLGGGPAALAVLLIVSA